jgi:glycosyltransferase involved in cell wall biosynthesis
VRILLLTDSDAFAGTEQHMLTLAVALQNQEQLVYVGCPNGSPLSIRCLESGISTVDIEKNGAIDFKAARDLIAFVKKNSIDVVHVHNGRTALIARLAKCIYPTIRVVFTQHFIAPSSANRSGVSKIVSYAIHSFIAAGIDHIICISAAVEDAINLRNDAYTRSTKTVIWNGIETSNVKVPCKDDNRNLRNDLEIPQSAKVILSASRLEPEKSVDLIVKAVAIICRDNPNVVLVIAGAGSEITNLQNLVTQLEIAPNVRFVGFRTDVNSLMFMADVFVIASEAEPFGLSILESMALGTPVIAANSGGPKEIIDDGVTGFLFVPGDVKALQTAVNRCLNLDFASDLTEHAKDVVNNRFNASMMASETLRTYATAQIQKDEK